MSEVATPQELDWFPCYPDRLLASGKWQAMKDFQRGWYWHLLVLMTRSKPLGYLPLDGRIWALAGAHSKQYWENHSALVLACFKVADFDGHRWVYSESLVKVLNEQTYKRDVRKANGRLGGQIKQTRSKSSLNYSFEFQTIWEKNFWKCVGKSKAYKAFQNSLGIIQKEKNCREDQALEFLADAVEEFKTSPAGKDNGLFESYTSPHPASWLSAQRYFDDRRTWRPVGERTNVAGKAGNGPSGTPENKSLADKGCQKCGGSGWDTSRGSAERCACWLKNRQANAAKAGS